MSRPRSILLNVGKGLISLLLLWWLLRGEMLGRVVEVTTHRFHLTPFLLGLGAFALSNLLGGLQWNILLRAQGIHIPLRRAISLYFVGLFFSNFLPANLGGDVVKVVDLYRSTGKGGGAVAATLMDRAAGLGVLSLMACLAGAFSWSLFGGEPFLLFLPLFFLFFAGGGLLVLSNRMVQLMQRLVTLFPIRVVREKVNSLLSALFTYRHNKRALLLALLIAIPVQTLRIGVHYLAARSIGVEASPLYFFLFIPIIAVFIALPLSINGLGIREGLGVYFYGLIGINKELAFSISFLAYIIGVVVSLAGGILFVIRPGGRKVRRAVPDLPQETESV